MKFHDIDQNTEQWLDLRMGKLTGSACYSMMATLNEYIVVEMSKENFAVANVKTKKVLKKRWNGKLLAERSIEERQHKSSSMFTINAKKEAIRMALEQITGKRQESNYSNAHMERGHEQEPIARAMYEDKLFVDVTNGGFFDCGNSGCSPDGLVGDDGVIEIKSVIATTHYATIKRGGFDPAYKWQLYFNLLKTGRNWIDFVSFCADFPEGKRLYVNRLNKSDCINEFEKIIEREAKYFELINEIKLKILS